MKKAVFVVLFCLIIFTLCAGCGNQTAKQEQTVAIGNPWSDWNSMEEAESAVGFSFGLPDVIADCYKVARIRTMSKELLEVVYCHESFEVYVRKQKGEGQDISGDYNEYDTCAETNHNGVMITTYQNTGNTALRQMVSYKGYSWSLVAPSGYGGASDWDFVNKILEQ